MKTKLTLVAIATSLAVGGTGLWLLISEKQAAWERREKFFGSSNEYPTSGGEKMKVEW